jgi:hypothetical protein
MLEVVMRPPDVFVRELSPDEGARLKQVSKRAKYQSKRQRATILLASSTGMGAPQVAGLMERLPIVVRLGARRWPRSSDPPRKQR